MDQILRFIVNSMAFLWAGASFRIVDSQVSTVNGGDALLFVESSTLRLQFVRDRGQLVLLLQSAHAGGDKWFDLGIVYRYIVGKDPQSGLLDEPLASFFEENLGVIENLMADDHWEAAYRDLTKMAVRRAKEHWG